MEDSDIPDILNSKIKELRIELPHFSFSHSSSYKKSQDRFIGRKDILKRLKELVKSENDKTGVYLITGNRGVGKSSLVNKVIKETSLTPDSFKILKYLFFLFCAVVGVQFCVENASAISFIANAIYSIGLSIRNIICFLMECFIPFFDKSTFPQSSKFWIFSSLCVTSFILLCCLNDYKRKIHKPLCNIADYFISTLKELISLKEPLGSYRITQYLSRIIFIASITQIIPIISHYCCFKTPTRVFVVYMIFILIMNILCEIYRFVRGEIRKYEQKNKVKILLKIICLVWHWCCDLFSKILNYIEGYNRVYLRINFGHKLKDEKDILRLIVRTLSTEYHKYLRSFWQMLPWRVLAFGLLFLFAYLFSNIVKEREFYKPIKKSILYNASSQAYFNDSICLGDTITYIKRDTTYTKDAKDKNSVISINKIDTIRSQWAFSHKENSLHKIFFSDDSSFYKVKIFLLVLDDIAFEISKKTVNVPQYFWNSGKNTNQFNIGKFISPINYLFWLSFFSMYLFCTLLFRCNWIMHFFVTHGIIKRKLKNLNSDITHNTERETSAGIAGYNSDSGRIGPGILTRTKKSRNIADAREIEKELQDIFENVKRIPAIMGCPKFVIVFDELDKVEPGESNSENASSETKATLFSIEATRERQSEILKIMSNMKYFLSTSEAKYIFIAGREMYDIYLADVSDRNNYIGSIFSTVIEVPSFLSDHAEKANRADMTSLTEEFVCRRLIPCDYPVAEYSYDLENYRKYLENAIYNYKAIKNEEKEKKKKIEAEIHKIIAVLQHFIIYLAHVSKGAPKKMMQLFEMFIEVCDIDENKKEKDKYLKVQYYKRSKFFLTFDYYKQYTLGLLAYLITPIFNRLVEVNLSMHNDKLLVSALRFVDFVFKFHKHSFSWKHLDISPEMLEVNRSPELRPITVELFNYMAQVHITKSNFSLFDYKFDNLIANEIFAATKTNEVLSALFSFSLDETLPLKKHYKDLLEKIQKEYQHDKNFSSTKFIDAISSLQIVLGDLHYYDDELEEAGTYYRDAVEGLRNLDSKNDDDIGRIYGDNKKHKDKDNEDSRDLETMNPEQLYTYIRNMLKVGLIYEKRKQHEFAYLIYGEICKRIIRERNITVKELGAGVAIRKEKNGKHLFVKVRTLSKITEKYNDNVEYPPISCGEEKVEYNIAQPQPLYFQRISPNTNDMLFRKMTYEGLKLLYMPFIAKLQILEKSHIGGITRTHLEHLDKEFELLSFIIDHEEANILEADFYSRVADVLYYKNSDLKSKSGKNRLDIDEDKYIEDMEVKKENADKSSEYNGNYKTNSCTACHYYHKALFRLLNKEYKEEEIKKRIKENTVIELLHKGVELLNDKCSNVKFCTVLARILSDWGNVFLSCDKKNKNGESCYVSDKIRNTQQHCYRCACYICDAENCETYYEGNVLKKYLNYVKCESTEDNRQELLDAFKSDCDFSKMEIALAMYAISFQAFRKASLNKRTAYQIYKMLRLLKCYRIYNEKYIKDEKYVQILSQKAISLLLQAADSLNVLELNKRKKDFSKETIKDKIPLQYLLVDSDITMIRILVKELELKSDKTPGKLSELYELHIASPYGIIYSIPARIFQLRFKSYVNYEVYQGITSLDKSKLIAESIFCLKDIIRLSKTLGENYFFNHSFMGKIHENLSFWIRLYETNPNAPNIGKYLKRYLGDGWKEQLSGHYENKQALSHYYKCLETHSEGKAYHTMIDNMHYVKDDYNDRSDHFNIAEERHSILNGKIDEKIKELKVIYEKSELYKVENYFENVEHPT